MFSRKIEGKFATVELQIDLLAGKICQHGVEAYPFYKAIGPAGAHKEICPLCHNAVTVQILIRSVK